MHGLTFDPPVEQFQASRFGKPLTVFAGANNSGKSLVLKSLKQRFGITAYMLSPQRFYHVPRFGPAEIDPNELINLENNFATQFNQIEYNHEQNYLDFARLFTNLTNERRQKLFDIAGQLLGSSISLRMTDPNNELSYRYIDIDGRNLSTASTGTRLLLTLLGTCMDERFSTILIDEPELGLSPRVQQSLAQFLADGSERAGYFPHLQSVFMATHSHLFLDRRDIQSNYSVSKDDDQVTLTPVSSIGEFHRLQFNLLGNNLEDMYLPAAIMIVEGRTDQTYLERIIQLRFPDRRITVTEAQGNVKAKVSSFRDSMGDLDRSPYKDRLFVVLDSVHEFSVPDWLRDHGVNPANIQIWSQNGIEYLYPTAILENVFNATPEQIAMMDISGDTIAVNGITRRKVELAAEVVARLVADTVLPEPLEDFLSKVAATMN